MSLQLYNIVKLDRRADRCNSCRIIDERQHRNKDIILVTTVKMWKVSEVVIGDICTYVDMFAVNIVIFDFFKRHLSGW